MKRIVVGGQIEKQKIAALVKEIGKEQVQVDIKGDMEAAMAVKAGQYDYYLGACHTGGGALAMAIALLGKEQCATVSSPGKRPQREVILQQIETGKKAFGFTSDHIEEAVPMIMEGIVSQK